MGGHSANGGMEYEDMKHVYALRYPGYFPY
jgi:hypothetical protein